MEKEHNDSAITDWMVMLFFNT